MLNLTQRCRLTTPNLPPRRESGSFRPNPTLEVAHIALGSLDMIMNLRSWMVCYVNNSLASLTDILCLLPWRRKSLSWLRPVATLIRSRLPVRRRRARA